MDWKRSGICRANHFQRFYWAAPTAADPEKKIYAVSDRERRAQILSTNIQTSGEAVTNHLCDTANGFRDDRNTQKYSTRPQKKRPRCLENPKKYPGRCLQSTLEHRSSCLRTPREATQGHQGEKVDSAAEGAPFPPPRTSTWPPCPHSAPGVYSTIYSHSN